MPGDNLKLNYGFFHANSKLLHRESSPYLYNAKWKHGHIVLANDIFSETLPYLSLESDVDTWISNNPGILQKYNQYTLTSAGGSSNEIWYIEDGGEWMRPWITPELVPNAANDPAYGYKPTLWKDIGSGWQQVWDFEGDWYFDPFIGAVKFADGQNPGDLGWAYVAITCYVYVGPTLYDKIQFVPDTYKYDSSTNGGPSVQHVITHNLDTMFLNVDIMVEDPTTLSWSKDMVGIEYVDNNTLNVDLTESSNIRVAIQSVK